MPVIQHIPLVLASGSAIRAQMLKGVGLQFSVAPSSVNEDAIKDQMKGVPHRELGAALARAKASEVAASYPDALTIGADQLCVCGDRIFDKPGTREKAEAQLHALSGKEHRQLSAVCVMRGGALIWEAVEEAVLTVRSLTDAEISAYIQQDQPLNSCGAYKFESMGRHLFDRVQGDHDVIKGLPLVSLLFTLRQCNAISLN